MTQKQACQRTKRMLGEMDKNINTNGTYLDDVDTGRQWLECSCTRWIHEDCIDVANCAPCARIMLNCLVLLVMIYMQT